MAWYTSIVNAHRKGQQSRSSSGSRRRNVPVGVLLSPGAADAANRPPGGSPGGPAVGAKPRHGERARQIRAMAVRFPEFSQADIAQQVGCTTGNVSTVLSRYLNGRSQSELSDFQSVKAEAYDALQMRILSSVTDELISKSSLQQIITSSAILQDKSMLLRGQPTSMHLNVLLDVAKAMRNSDTHQDDDD